MIEIERKYLVTGDGWKSEALPGTLTGSRP